ncbi:interleukin-15 receptor subunit alpha isoform 3-T3 [Odontesthes bonariensis]|uniref:interleukin-15 receptor subunit alpha isoform X3 n=1 Tax=Odontesthes bonariensis TaxID=219752 RepID=UPI003F58ECBE
MDGFFAVIMVYLLGCARLSSGASCPCPGIPQRPLTKPPPQDCFQINESFRYICIERYVRKAGTSNRIVCTKSNGGVEWTTFNLKCIPDPKLPTHPQNRTESGSDISHDPIVTSTVTETSTGVETVWSVSTSVSPSGGTNSVEPTPQVMQTTVNTCTKKSPTLSPTSSEDVISARASSFETNVKAAAISLSVLITICALTGLSLFLYRRVHRNPSQQKADEVEPMNRPVELEM